MKGPGLSAAGATNSYACQPLAQINLAAAQATAVVTAGTVATTQAMLGDARIAANQVQLADFNVEAAQQDTALTSKVFTKVTYEWVESNYRPHLGVMGEFEISTSNNNALPQWAIVLAGGVSF